MIPTPPSPAPRRFGCAAASTIIAVLLLGLLAFVFVRLESWPVRNAARGVDELERVARDLRSAFVKFAKLQPRVTVNNRIYLEQISAVAELAVVSRRIEVEHEMLHTWAGSTKRVRLHGTFVVKAGFDLRQSFSADVRTDAISLQLPRAQILGVEQVDVQVLTMENGFWNPVSSGDLEQELKTLPQLARAKAMESGLTNEAERTLRAQIESNLQVKQPIQLTFAAPSPAG